MARGLSRSCPHGYAVGEPCGVCGTGVPAGGLKHAGPYALQCYACQVRVDRNGSMAPKRLARWERYEAMVEYIEGLPRGAEVWRPVLAREVFGGGPTNWTVAGQVVHDMAIHGLLHPVRHREGGNTRYYRKVY